MTVTIDGELLVSQWNDSKIMCISHDTCRTLIELPFGDIVGIHASRHNDIFIGMVVELGIQPLNAISTRTHARTHARTHKIQGVNTRIYDYKKSLKIRVITKLPNSDNAMAK